MLRKNEESAEGVSEEEIYKDFAEFANESLQMTIGEEGDSFEIYMDNLKAHFCTHNPDAFKARFIKGYKVLLEEVIQEK